MEFEGTPIGKSEKTKDEIEALRREGAKQFEEQAHMRNKSRSILKRIFGIGKESGIDIAHEEALRINKLVDQKKVKYSAQAASEEIVSSSEFKENEAIIDAEEFIQSENPDIEDDIQSGDIALARELFAKLSEETDGIGKETLREGLEKMIESQITKLGESGDIAGLRELLRENELDEIGLENLSSLPSELAHEPEFQDKLKDHLANHLVSRLRDDAHGAEDFVEDADMCVRMNLLTHKGLMDFLAREDLAKLISSPEYQAKIRGELADKFHGDVYDAKKFVEAADKYVQMNLLTPQAVAEIISSEDFQDKIQNDLADLFRYRDSFGSDEAIEIAEEYVRLGFMTKEMSAQVIADLRSEFGVD